MLICHSKGRSSCWYWHCQTKCFIVTGTLHSGQTTRSPAPRVRKDPWVQASAAALRSIETLPRPAVDSPVRLRHQGKAVLQLLNLACPSISMCSCLCKAALIWRPHPITKDRGIPTHLHKVNLQSMGVPLLANIAKTPSRPTSTHLFGWLAKLEPIGAWPCVAVFLGPWRKPC